MQLTFLGASDTTPLAKRFVRDESGTLTTHSYPFVRNFTSFAREPASLEEALDMLTAHAEAGHCLLKGQLTRPIENESRAGLTRSTEATDYILLDLDFDEGFTDIDDFLAQIGLDNVSYILHRSSSAGIKYHGNLRCHVLMQLAEPQMPSMLKLWLQHLNLTLPALRPQLAASKLALTWPLDVTTCQNDKLIYIADPVVEGLDDPLAGQRFSLVTRTRSTATINFAGVDPASIQNAQNELIAELRRGLGLPNKAIKLNADNVLLNPDQAVVTGVREQRGYTRLNLNGGDSWAYWYHNDNPEILYSFKGDPPVRLADIAPDYYNDIKQHDPVDLADPQVERFVCRDNATDTYYTCIYRPEVGHVELARAQRKHLGDFLAMTGERMPGAIPEWTITFDPTTTQTYDPDRRWINTFRPTKYMTVDPNEVTPHIGPQISRILWSLCGEQEVYDYFMNWLAYVFQTRKKPQTAILFHGEEGTGKGLLYSRILKPLFGYQQTIEMKAEIIRQDHNGWARNKIVVCLDEFEVTERDTKTTTDLRNLITEHHMTLREMRRDGQEITQYLAFILFTNVRGALPIPVSDRRFTIAPRQENRLEMTDAQVNSIEDELPGFAAFLLSYEVNADRVRTPLETHAKQIMRENSEPTHQRVLRAFREMDLQFFIDNMETSSYEISLRQTEYNALVRQWYARRHEPVILTLDHFHNAYQVLVGAKTITRSRTIKLFNDQIGPINADRTKTMTFREVAYPPASGITSPEHSNVTEFPTAKRAAHD